MTTRASRDEIVGIREGVLRIRVSAPPAEGRANEAVRRLIAKRAGVAPSGVEIVGGHRSREKLLAVRGASAEQLGRLR